ncbi:TetR/AcrR family transcriptional regulator [Curtobacterium sp. PhB146]|uniref:TetR/AcrR family transcriptional regulator n=1 Tax=Curtobacterium sp. PhB146 TaxID=2485187 RepID=UPI001051056D|nr:TetR/AcrR family transcriptional regulator [Curtobacterium sp. PhB146]TCU46852.1 TetR family transcriptional regulator [Curtobacterium sp. PhB146]
MSAQARPYHHGSLRQELVREGRALLVEEGQQAVTVRELARRVGVSHGAPLRHFRDREAVLDAIAADGFDELRGHLEAARGPGDLGPRLTEYVRAHVRFAQENGPLVQLMFTSTDDGPRPDGDHGSWSSAERFFALGAELLGERDPASMGPVPFLLAATTEGISALAAAGRIPPERVDEVVVAAVRMLLPQIEQQLGRPSDVSLSQSGP